MASIVPEFDLNPNWSRDRIDSYRSLMRKLTILMTILDIVAIIEMGRKFLAMLVGPFLWIVDMTDSRQVDGIDEGKFQTMRTSLSRRDTNDEDEQENLT